MLSSLAILLAVIAFELVGYLGLAMLGLLTLLVCANVELGKDGPLGGINNPELHAWDAAHRESLTRAERAEHRSETGALLRSLFFVRLIGGVFVVIGFGGFFFVQQRRGR